MLNQNFPTIGSLSLQEEQPVETKACGQNEVVLSGSRSNQLSRAEDTSTTLGLRSRPSILIDYPDPHGSGSENNHDVAENAVASRVLRDDALEENTGLAQRMQEGQNPHVDEKQNLPCTKPFVRNTSRFSPRNLLRRLLRPGVPIGRQRIEWTCVSITTFLYPIR